MLTREEVLHVANLARIDVNEEEIDNYRKELKELITEIDKIKDVEITTDEIMVSPVEENARLRDDNVIYQKEFDDIKTNIPKSLGNFVEVVVMVNE